MYAWNFVKIYNWWRKVDACVERLDVCNKMCIFDPIEIFSIGVDKCK